MNVDFDFKSQYDINDLLRIMTILRQPGGCPWDREQTHSSIRMNFIEEVYEAVEAIDKDDPAMLCEELGDVLMQVVFHSEIAREAGQFDFSSVADGICRKLIERHPHVFGDVKVTGSDEVLANWDRIKQAEKSRNTVVDAIDSVPAEFPALMRAQKIQKRAAKFGYEFPSSDDALAKIGEETAEVRQAAAGGSKDALMGEVGDLLFSAVNAARMLGVDAEEALTFATDKFSSRVKGVEALCAERGVSFSDLTPEQFDSYWEEVKRRLNAAD